MASEIINNAVAGPESVPVAPGIGGVPAGLDPSSPDAQKALSDYGRSAGYIGKSLATGMAAGTQAAQGATNPLSAFMQGMSAGLQAPAQVFQAKRNQIQSAFEATPFGVTHPEVIADHPGLKMLAGLPTGLVMPAIATIAIQSAKVYEEKKAAIELKAVDFRFEALKDAAKSGIIPPEKQVDFAIKFKSSPEVVEYKKIDNEYNIIKSMPNDIVGHTTILAKYIQMLSPTARLNESTMEVTDPSGIIDKWTKDMVSKIAGKGLMGPDERAKIENVAAIMHARSEAKYANYKSAYLENLGGSNFNPGLMGEEPKTFTKDGVTIEGYLIGGKIVPVGGK